MALTRCRQSFSCPDGLWSFWRRQRGAAAVVLVIGSILIMLAIGATVAGQARHELRISKAETESQQASLLIQGGFALARQLAAAPTWPQTAHTGNYACPPKQPYPSFCVEAQPRSGGASMWEQIPFRVQFRVSEGSALGTAYGWIVYDGSVPEQTVRAVRPYHFWCTPDEDSTHWNSVEGPCKPGG